MTIDTANAVRRVRATQPVPEFFIPSVAAQAGAVSRRGRAFRKADDLRDFAAARDVKAAIAMAVLAFDTLLGMKGVLKVLGYLGVAGCAGLSTDPGGARNFYVLGE